MTLLFVYFGLSVLLSFLCSLSEAIILSVSPAYISLLEKEGRRSGRLLHNLRVNVDRPLSAVLTINTIANTCGAMLVGQEITKVFGSEALGIGSGVLTLVILVFSEILPKIIGALHAKKLAPTFSYIITGMVIVTLPFVYFARFMSRLIARTGHGHRTSREEVIATAEMGADDGVILQKESRIIRNLLMLSKIKVSEIMTPRSVVNAFEASETVGGIMDKYKPVRFSRIPLFEGNSENVIGLLHRYRLMEAVAHDMYNMPLKDIMSGIHRVKEDQPVAVALDEFIRRREHLFLVEDSHGVMSGIVTLEDAIETLLGVEIVDQYDSITDMRQYALEQWRIRKDALLKK